MFNEVKKSIQWGQETLTLETGKVARQADGTVIATLRRNNRHGQRHVRPQAKAGSGFLPADRALPRKVLRRR